MSMDWISGGRWQDLLEFVDGRLEHGFNGHLVALEARYRSIQSTFITFWTEPV